MSRCSSAGKAAGTTGAARAAPRSSDRACAGSRPSRRCIPTNHPKITRRGTRDRPRRPPTGVRCGRAPCAPASPAGLADAQRSHAHQRASTSADTEWAAAQHARSVAERVPDHGWTIDLELFTAPASTSTSASNENVSSGSLPPCPGCRRRPLDGAGRAVRQTRPVVQRARIREPAPPAVRCPTRPH